MNPRPSLPETRLDGPPLILIVDDTPENLRILGNQLERARYDVALAENGERALRFLDGCHPDLILLDLMMPTLDGYEVCRRIKENSDTRHIPIIFLTARVDLDDIVRGFEAGAVDYVCKPYQAAELLARVSTHLELKRSRETITRHNQTLAQLNEQLRSLVQEKDEFLSIAAHDLNSPLQIVAGLAANWHVRAQQESHPDLARDMDRIQQVVDRMGLIVRNLLCSNEIESGRFEFSPSRFEIGEVTRQVLDEYRQRAATKQIQLDYAGPGHPIWVQTSRFAVVQVLDNLISNAIKFSPPGSLVTARINVGPEGSASWTIEDHGPGLTVDDRRRLFSKFARLSARPTAGESSTGLGLTIVKKLTEALGGDISVESTPGAGATFTLRLPSSPPSDLTSA